MDGLVAAAQGAGRCGGLVRLVAGGAGGVLWASELLGADGCKANGFDLFDKIAFWRTRRRKGASSCPVRRWTQDYIAIMGGR